MQQFPGLSRNAGPGPAGSRTLFNYYTISTFFSQVLLFHLLAEKAPQTIFQPCFFPSGFFPPLRTGPEGRRRAA